MPTLKQLRYLDALATHRHFGRAAQSCRVSQPALSMQIADLEAELGVIVLERLRRELVFTARGAEIATRGRDILTAVNDLVDFARQSEGPLAGTLRLGVIPSVAPYLLHRLLPLLKRDYPGLGLTLYETQTTSLLLELQQGRIDAALLALPSEMEGLVEMVLFDDPFLLALPADHPLASLETVSPQDLEGERVLLLEQGHCLRDQAVSFCRGLGIVELDGLGATSLSTLVQMVANGYGVTLLPRLAVQSEMRDPCSIVVKSFRQPAPQRRLGLVWRSTSPRAPDFEAMGRLIQQTAGDP